MSDNLQLQKQNVFWMVKSTLQSLHYLLCMSGCSAALVCIGGFIGAPWLSTEVTAKLTKSVTYFSLDFAGLIGRNRRVGVVSFCRLNLLVRWQSSSLSSSSNSRFMLFLNLEDYRLPINNNWKESKAVLRLRACKAALDQSKHRTFRQ